MNWKQKLDDENYRIQFHTDLKYEYMKQSCMIVFIFKWYKIYIQKSRGEQSDYEWILFNWNINEQKIVFVYPISVT